MRKVANGVALWLSMCFSRAKPTVPYASHIAVFGLAALVLEVNGDKTLFDVYEHDHTRLLLRHLVYVESARRRTT